MKKIIITTIALVYASAVIGQEAYICLPSVISGFHFKSSSGNWEQSRFRIGDKKKILKKTDNKWEWKAFGEKYSFSTCGDSTESTPTDGFNSAGFIFCDLLGGHLRMNKNSLRYIETYEIGYVDGKDNNDNTPYIEIGTCSPL